MGFLRVIICIIFPPLAVLDKGCGSILLVTILSLCFWIPGILAALIICSRQDQVIIIQDGVAISAAPKKTGIGTIILAIFLLAVLISAVSSSTDAINRVRQKTAGTQAMQVALAQPPPSASATSAQATTFKTVSDAQAEAIRRFPDLAKKDSALNKAFLALYNEAKTSRPALLTAPDWPIRLAEKAAAAQK
ncbi:MAG: YqaE/Pmp3 family membrane protein [Chthoniobacteraceae bacterium]